jgi:hypothetical protein
LPALTFVGLFTVASLPYLVLITRRKQVAQICGKPIYVISGVTIVPLASFTEAKSAIESSKKLLTQGVAQQESDTSDDESSHEELHSVEEAEELATPFQETPPQIEPASKGSSIAQDVISKKGFYGRFTDRWFSKKGWSAERRRSQGMSSSSLNEAVKTEIQKSAEQNEGLDIDKAKEQVANQTESSPQADSSMSMTVTLLPKLLRTTRLLLNSESFYFSYDHDLTRRLGTFSGKGTDIPLHKKVDPVVSKFEK